MGWETCNSHCYLKGCVSRVCQIYKKILGYIDSVPKAFGNTAENRFSSNFLWAGVK